MKLLNDTVQQAENYTRAQRRVLGGNMTVLAAVNGYNYTEVLQSLLESKLKFHGLSLGAKKWGKLATFLTKVRALEHQVQRGHPFQVTLEDDVQSGFRNLRLLR